MIYHYPEEIFTLMKDEVNARKAEKVYRLIVDSYPDTEIVSLRSCISLARKGDNYRKYATITREEGNALLLHFPLEIRDNINSNKVKFEKAKRYHNQINIRLEEITDVENLLELIELAYKNPRKIRFTK